LEAIPGKNSIDSLQKTGILGTLHLIWKVMQSETFCLNSGDCCWFRGSTRKKKPVTKDDDDDDDDDDNNNNNNRSSSSSNNNNIIIIIIIIEQILKK